MRNLYPPLTQYFSEKFEWMHDGVDEARMKCGLMRRHSGIREGAGDKK